MPPANNREDPQQPPSPTSDPHKRRRIQTIPTDQKEPVSTEHRMAIDKEAMHTRQSQKQNVRADVNNVDGNQEHQGQNLTTKNDPRAQPINEEMEVEVNEEVEEILATLETTSKIKQMEAMLSGLLDKHTDTDMPPIFSNSPAGLLEGLEKDQACKWVLNTQGRS